MKTIGSFIKCFLYITTGVLIVCGASFTFSGVEMVPVDTFWKVLFSGFVTTLVTVLILPKEEDGKVKTYIKFALHYIALCIVMSLFGVWFGWMDFDFSGIVMMVVDVGLVYLLTFFAYYIIDRKQADDINKRLREKYGDDEA